ALAEAVTAAALREVRPGVRECEVAGEALGTLYRLGGEYPHVTTPLVASGERMAPPARLATDKLIRDGDPGFVHIGAMVNGYFGDIGRTIVCGTPSAEQRRVYRAVHDALQAGIAAMRPGGHEPRGRPDDPRAGEEPRSRAALPQPVHRARDRLRV